METTQRQAYLDWLRIFSILGVLLLHSAMPYAAEADWHIKNAETSHLMMESNYFLHLIRMPLLFFISGTVSYYMMQRHTGWSFIGIRFTRLFIPLLVGIIIIVPPQVYIERLTQGFKGNFWDFYPSVYKMVPYPKGNFSWHHLWFILYLFIYDLALAPFFSWMVSPRSTTLINKIAALAVNKRIYLLTIVPVLWYGWLSSKLPETNSLLGDGCYFIYWLFFLLAGFVCIIQPKLMDSLERNRRFSLTIGFVSLIVLYYVRWNQISLLDDNSTSGQLWAFGFRIMKSVIAWGWVLAFVGYGKRYLNKTHKMLGYLNQAAYPFYILHQTVIVILSYYIIHAQNESILSKYLYTIFTTLFITIGIFHLLIKPYPVMRFLFGMKPLNKKAVLSADKEVSSTVILHQKLAS